MGTAARATGVLLVAAASLWTVAGLGLFIAHARGQASALFAIPPADADTALRALGWRPEVVFAATLTVQVAVLVATVVAAGFVLATTRTTAYTAALAVTLVLFAATATQATVGWRIAVPGSGGMFDIVQTAVPLAFLSLLALFPSGRAVPRWSVAIPLLWLTLGAFSLVLPWWRFGGAWVVVPSVLAIVLVLATIVAQVIRYRRFSDRTARQQTKWVMLAFGLYLASLLPVFVLPPGTIDGMTGPAGVAFVVIRGSIAAVLFGFIAVAIAFAVARYRLFDVDLVIRRTLVWGLLVVAIAGLYVALVWAAALLWQDSGVVAAGFAALAVALVAHPLRTWLQRRATRWVYGGRGDPYRVVSRLEDDLRGERTVAQICTRVAEVLVDDLRYSGATVRVGGHGITRGDAGTRVADAIPLMHDGQRLGTLTVTADAGDRPSAADRRLVKSVAAHAELAIGAALAAEALRGSRDRLLAAREEERQRLFRDLHDGLGPGLAGARQRVQTAMTVAHTHPDAARRLLVDASAAMAAMLADVRALVHGLRPPALDELGLSEAVRRAAQPLTTPDAPTLTVGAAPPALPPAVEVATYRIAVEAVTNAVRHAAASRIDVSFTTEDGMLVVTVDDDGTGPGDAEPGAGRRSMRQRAEDLGGDLRLTRSPTSGTRVRATLPMPEPRTEAGS